MRDDKADRRAAIGLIIAGLSLLGLVAFLIFFPPPAHAEGQVWVDPRIDGSTQIQTRIESRLDPGDGIVVTIYPDWGKVDVVGDWSPGELWLDAKADKAAVVTSNPVDQALLVVSQIHEWQKAHPKPLPPAPPPPPRDWTWAWVLFWFGVAFGVVWSIIAFNRHRRARKLEVLRRFEEFDPANPYGDYKPVDLGE